MKNKSLKHLFLLTLLFIFSIIFISSFALAQTGKSYNLKLLAVQETSAGYMGSDADLFLELKEGSGRVFLETVPLTKLDTQISTRFAKEIACHHFNLECDKYDFIYTIKAKSSIVGGPSAGAAIAALTTIAVLDLKYDEKTTITGTINSGGILGPVGGGKEKLKAAANAGLKKVLIAPGTNSEASPEEENKKVSSNYTNISSSEYNQTNNNNNTDNNSFLNNSLSIFNLTAYGQTNLNIETKEVTSLDEVIFELTGKNINQEKLDIEVNPQYNTIMQELYGLICQRTVDLRESLDQKQKIDSEIENQLRQKNNSALNASSKGDYYAAASYCFTNNLVLKKIFYEQKRLPLSRYPSLFTLMEKKIDTLEKDLAQEEISTISSLQAYMIIKERLQDAKKQIEKYKENLKLENQNKENIENNKDSENNQNNKENLMNSTEAGYLLAYVEERYFSAVSWQKFMEMDGKKLVINPVKLKESCQNKISEAEERYQYASLFLGELNLQTIRERLDSAKKSYDGNETVLCLIGASQAKAEADVILGTMGLTEADIPRFLESKKTAVERVIAKNTAQGFFPILGYSYYQYANSLQNDGPFDALMYLEYSLEMSDLQIYFPEKDIISGFSFKLFLINQERWIYLAVGLIFGALIGFLIGWQKKKPLRFEFVGK